MYGSRKSKEYDAKNPPGNGPEGFLYLLVF